MRNFSSFAVIVGVLASLSLSSGCSGDDAGPAACGGFDYDKYTPGSTRFTLKDNIQPLFARACAFSSCHGVGGPETPMLGPGLGMPADDAMLATISGNLVGKPSMQAENIKLVTPGLPRESYIMNKVEGTFCNLSCVGDVKCGVRMPQNSTPLSAADLAMLRDWIAQGVR